MYWFEIYIDSSGEYRWRFKASNGEILADSGEGYTSKQACRGGIQVLKDGAGAYQQYEDNRGEWRWRFRAQNGRIVADSGEGYSSKYSCQYAVDRMRREVPTAHVRD